MIKYLLIIYVLAWPCGLFCSAQENLAVNKIADSLLSNANAVLRYSTYEYERESPARYSLKARYAITILNANGLNAAQLIVPYDNNSKIRDIKCRFLDKNGNRSQQVKSNGIRDRVAYDGYSLYSDNRLKTIVPRSNTFPFTVCYEYEINYKGTVGLPMWMPASRHHLAVQEAELIFKTASDNDINTKSFNYDFHESIRTDGKRKTYRWQVKNLPASKSESYSPSVYDYEACLLISPQKADYEGHAGDFSSWKNYGLWVQELIEGRDELPEDRANEIRQMSYAVGSRKEKVKLIYEYMQNRTRYVSIPLGIGGFQPFDAASVDKTGYGDCKALSNYTKALLKCCGIESHYAEIGSGSRKIRFPDFPGASQTNHVILCVPLEEDTVWLECTNQNYPFNYIGPNNSNRKALLITGEGGVLVNTPHYDVDDNQSFSNIKIDIIDDEAAEIELEREYRNCLFNQVFRPIYSNAKEREEWINYLFDPMKCSDYHFEDQSNGTAIGFMHIKGKKDRYSQKSGNFLFVPIDFFHLKNPPRQLHPDRDRDVYIPMSFSHTDTLQICYPENFKSLGTPKDSSMLCEIGSFSVQFEENEKGIRIVHHLSINEGNYSKDRFEEINKFLGALPRKGEWKLLLKEE